MAFRLSTAAALATVALLSGLCGAAPALAPTTDLVTSSVKRDSSDLKFPFGKEKVRGVSLGGWLVLESWITPSIFEACDDSVVDEWTMGESLGPEEFLKRQKKHWSTWIDEHAIKEISETGLNFIRIPIGYWSVSPIPGTPYITGAYPYLGKALDWAHKYGLKVMIDLHGAPGSQNGYDNSGHKGPIDWNTGDTVAQTYTALNKIRDDHADHPAVATIEVLNEPYTAYLGRTPVRNFYTQAYDNLKSHKKLAVSIQDAYQPLKSWNEWTDGKANVIVDAHPYQIFKNRQLKWSLKHHVNHACSKGSVLKSLDAWAIAGEFTGATTDCAKWLNGRGIGARYDGSYEGSTYIGSCKGLTEGTIDDLSASQKHTLKTYIEAQMTAWEKADGWIFWAWKTESAPEWNYKMLHKHGFIPKFGSLDGSACPYKG